MLPLCTYTHTHTHTHSCYSCTSADCRTSGSNICDGCGPALAFCSISRAVWKLRIFSPFFMPIKTQKQHGLRSGKCGCFVTAKLCFVPKTNTLQERCVEAHSYGPWSENLTIFQGFYAERYSSRLSEIPSKYRNSLPVPGTNTPKLPKAWILSTMWTLVNLKSNSLWLSVIAKPRQWGDRGSIKALEQRKFRLRSHENSSSGSQKAAEMAHGFSSEFCLIIDQCQPN